MLDEIRQALYDAITRLDPEASDISLPDDVAALERGELAQLSISWKSREELHLGQFSAWREASPEFVSALNAALRIHGIPVPELVTTGRSGSTNVILASPVDGASMASEIKGAGMRWEISAISFSWARALARLHSLDWTSVAPDFADPEALPEDIIDDQVENEFARRREQIESTDNQYRDFARRIVDWLELRRPVEVDLCICHGDFRPSNIYAKGEDVTAIVSWSDARVTDASYDLAMLPVWLSDLGLSTEEVELFAQAAYGAYLQSSKRGLANLPYYAVSRPFDQFLEAIERPDQVDERELAAIQGTIERAMILGGRVPWKSR